MHHLGWNLYSPHLHDSIAYDFIPNSSIFIELYSIYYASSQNCPFWEIFHMATVITVTRNLHPSKPVPLTVGMGKLG